MCVLSVCKIKGLREKEREAGRERERERERERAFTHACIVILSLPTLTLALQVHEGFDPAELGDTIRQLALSVQDTGMFGDLPRPRMMGPRGR